MRRRKIIGGLLSAFLVAAGLGSTPALAQSDGSSSIKVGSSGLPIPRFVSLKSARVNLRVGPGTNYAVSWMYTKAGLPVEIIQEFDNWRRIRDVDGTDGWVNQALLSGNRTGIVAPWLKDKESTVPLVASTAPNARRVADVEPGALGNVNECDGAWCLMRFGSHEGWIQQDLIWGVYPGEIIDD